jgi:hypothetical protein
MAQKPQKPAIFDRGGTCRDGFSGNTGSRARAYARAIPLNPEDLSPRVPVAGSVHEPWLSLSTGETSLPSP